MSEFDPLDLTGQAKAKVLSEDEARIARQIELDDFKFVMDDKRGRRLVWRLLEKTGVFRSSFTGNSETFFREGARNVGLMLMGLIHEACPEKYTLMLKEQREHGRRRNAGDRDNSH